MSLLDELPKGMEIPEIEEMREALKPGEIGNIKLKNRIVCSSMCTSMGKEDGYPQSSQEVYYTNMARSGVGLLITEPAVIDYPRGRSIKVHLSIDDDSRIKPLSRISRAIRKEGGKSAIQLIWSGRRTEPEVAGEQPVAPSEVPAERGPVEGIKPRKMSIDEIKEVEKAYAMGAERAKKAGFDAVELHHAHGYGANQFLSPRVNKRDDRYGGSLENRMRFALEIIEEIRKGVGSDYPVITRFNVDDFVEGGFNHEESLTFAKRLEEVGTSALNISGKTPESMDPSGSYLTEFQKPGCWLPLMEDYQEIVDIPTIVGTRVHRPELAEKVIRENIGDFVYMARATLADRDFLKKAIERRFDDIISCVGCRHCVKTIYKHDPIRCMVNPEAGRDKETQMTPAEETKNVLVVGGGPSGIEAARISFIRGHEVTLCEKDDELGGSVSLAEKIPRRSEICNVIKDRKHWIEKLGIDVNLNTEATPEYIQEGDFDVVIFATGGKPDSPNIEGIKEIDFLTPEEVIDEGKNGNNNVVLCPGQCCGVESYAGCQTLLYVREIIDENSTLICPADKPLWTLSEYVVRPAYLKIFEETGINVVGGAKVKSIDENKIHYKSDGQEKSIEYDEIITPKVKSQKEELDSEFGSALQRVPEYHYIGDCKKIGNIVDAIYDGFKTGLEI